MTDRDEGRRMNRGVDLTLARGARLGGGELFLASVPEQEDTPLGRIVSATRTIVI